VAPGLRIVASNKELEAAYISAFETNMPQPSVSLYEGSHHLQGNKPGLLLELKGFYRSFGLTMAESENDLEDSLVAELEFMQFLTAKQAQAEDGSLDKSPYLRAQKDFLERHLAAWLPSLLADAEGKLNNPFYRALVVLANRFVASDTGTVERDVASLNVYLPCSSYRSFVATADSENDVKEMRAIKSFCLRQGMDIAGSLDDLSDCLCIELKFMRVQCFREHDAAIHGNAERKASLQAVEAEFLGRFLTPFTSRLADIDIQSNPTSPYSHLLEALRHFVSHHFMEFEAMTREPAVS
jgi:DMSO reductase family type II enzyme chaperone